MKRNKSSLLAFSSVDKSLQDSRTHNMNTSLETTINILILDPMDDQSHVCPRSPQGLTSSLGICQCQVLASGAVSWCLHKPAVSGIVRPVAEVWRVPAAGQALVLLGKSLETQSHHWTCKAVLSAHEVMTHPPACPIPSCVICLLPLLHWSLLKRSSHG